MKNRQIFISLVALGLVAAGVLQCCSGVVEKKDASGMQQVQKELQKFNLLSPKPFIYEENGGIDCHEIELVRAILKDLRQVLVKFERQSGQIFPGLDSDRYQMPSLVLTTPVIPKNKKENYAANRKP